MNGASTSFERLLADLSERFVNVLPSVVDQHIEQSLREIVDALEALDGGRATLMEFSDDASELGFTDQWARECIHSDAETIASEELP
jgi:hypothetical protein